MFDTYFFICFIDEVISSLRSLKSSIFVMNAMIIPEPREIKNEYIQYMLEFFST